MLWLLAEPAAPAEAAPDSKTEASSGATPANDLAAPGVSAPGEPLC
jgi:hypothetical protein